MRLNLPLTVESLENKLRLPGKITRIGWTALAIPLYLAVVTGLLLALFSDWAYDDPFIIYRYARNLANGLGFVYNPGERVLSTTTALYPLILAGLMKIWPFPGLELPLLSNLIGCLFLTSGGLLLYDLARTWKTPIAGWVCLFVYPTFPNLVTSLGSEMSLYIGLCLAALAAYARRRWPAAALFAGLAALARPDGLLVALVLGAAALRRHSRNVDRTRRLLPPPRIDRRGMTGQLGSIFASPILQMAAIFLAVIGPWVLFAWVYFGSPAPVTLAAKQYQGAMAIGSRFLPGLVALFRSNLRQWFFALQALMALFGIIWWTVARLMPLIRRFPGQVRPAPETEAEAQADRETAGGWGLLLAWQAAYILAYTLLGVSRYFWYYAPLAAGWAAAIGLGIHAIWNMRWPWPGLQARRIRPGAILAIPILAAIVAGQFQALVNTQRITDARMSAFIRLGQWLYTHTPPAARVATLEIGAIGFYAERTMIDFAGLIQPEVGPILVGQDGYDHAAEWAAERFQPDYIVLREQLFPGLEKGYIASYCRSVFELPAESAGYPWITRVFACSPSGG